MENGTYYRRRADELLDNRMAALEKSTSEGLASIHNRVDELEGRLRGMEVKLGALIALGSILGPVLMERLLK